AGVRGGPGRLALVRGRPAPVGLGRLDLPGPGRAHASLRDEPLDLAPVDPRPRAARPAGGELLHPAGVVVAALEAVDPAEAERHLDRLGVRHGRDATRLG